MRETYRKSRNSLAYIASTSSINIIAMVREKISENRIKMERLIAKNMREIKTKRTNNDECSAFLNRTKQKVVKDETEPEFSSKFKNIR